MAKLDYNAMGIKAAHTFDQLVVGSHNQIAAGASKEVAKAPGERYNPLFIYGGPGVGKTHLMQAVANEMLKKDETLKVRYMSAERFTSEVISAVAEDRVMAVRQGFSDLDLFILDDVQFLVESKATQAEFFHIFNNLHQSNKQVIMAADCSPQQLQMLDQTIRSRLEWGLAVDVKIPDEPTRVEILKLKQTLQGLSLTDDVLRYVAQILRSNVRELEGFLKRLHAYVTLSHQELSMDLIKHVVEEIMPAGTNLNPPPSSSPAVAAAPAADKGKVIGLPKAKEPTTNGAHKKPEPEAEVPVAPEPPKPAVNPASEPPKPELKPTPEPPLVKKAVPEPPAPEPVAAAASAPTAVLPVETVPNFEDEDDLLPTGHKEVTAVFFYPARSEKQLDTVDRKFQDVIKKHKLKFRLKKVHAHPYECKGKINYSSFVDVCKQNKVPVAIVIGPPPDAFLPEQDFYDLLSVTLDVQGVSLQLVNWAEIDKDYRYLNLALDIALVRTR